MASLFSGERLIALDSSGKVISGAQLWFYQTGTTTPQTVYADVGATTPLSNPVVADAGGLFPAIYLANTNAYKTVLQTSLGATVRTTDPVSNGAGSSTTFTPQGRLTLASGSPVMTSNQASATSIIYTPYTGNQFPVYDGVSAFSALTFAELTNSTTASSVGNAGPAAVGANKNYDLFVWSNAGVATLTRGAAWNSDTARSATTENDLTRINGVPVNLNAITNGPTANKGTYVGTVRSDGSSQINWVLGGAAVGGTAALLNVWNMYNRVNVDGFVADAITAGWQYSAGTVRPANSQVGVRVSWVAGQQEDFFRAEYRNMANAVGSGNIGIGLDVTNSITGIAGHVLIAGTGQDFLACGSTEQRLLGFHFAQACEQGDSANLIGWSGVLSGVQVSGLRYNGRF